jgi:hypothetical protein
MPVKTALEPPEPNTTLKVLSAASRSRDFSLLFIVILDNSPATWQAGDPSKSLMHRQTKANAKREVLVSQLDLSTGTGEFLSEVCYWLIGEKESAKSN